MKNYPILNIKNFTPYKVYNNNYLKELNSLVFSLFQYSENQIPDYKRLLLEEVDAEFDASILHFHNYFRLKQDMDIKIGDFVENYSAGTVVLSKAKAEGSTDYSYDETETNPILLNPDNYFLQPMGWGSYYVPHFKQENKIKKYIFEFDQYAEEKYGREIYFPIDPFYLRYFLNKEVYFNNSSADVVIQSKSGENNYIIDRQNHLWIGYDTNPIMHFTFLKSNINDNSYGEEIITDTIREVSTFDKSNIGSYTIISTDGSRNWPDDGHKIALEII